MKNLIPLCLLALLLTGCSTSQDDRDFYYRGWIHPTDLDHERAPAAFKAPAPVNDTNPAPSERTGPPPPPPAPPMVD